MNLKYLKEERLKNNFTQKQFAEILEISYIGYKFIETGKRNASFELLVKIINTLKLDANKLLNIEHQISA